MINNEAYHCIIGSIDSRAEASNLEMAEYLCSETEAGFKEVTRKIIRCYKQPEVLRYVVEAIMEDIYTHDWTKIGMFVQR